MLQSSAKDRLIASEKDNQMSETMINNSMLIYHRRLFFKAI